VLGCHSIRCNTGARPGDADALDRCAESFAALVEYADANGINVLIENHWGLSSDPAWLMELMARVDHPRFGTLPDFGNFPDEIDRYDAVARMMPRAIAVSAKCYDFDATGNETKVDFDRMMRVAEGGYHGYVGIEYEGAPQSARASSRARAARASSGKRERSNRETSLIATTGAGFMGRPHGPPARLQRGGTARRHLRRERGAGQLEPRSSTASRTSIATGEMIEREKPDAVSVCLPNVLHREPVARRLEAGAHVLCEKPLATSVAEAGEMFACARRAGRHLMAAQNWRWDAGSRAVRRIVDTGDLGEVYYAEATALRRMGIPSWGVFHQSKLSSGGALLDVGVHMLDLAVWLMGNPEPVRVSAKTDRKFGTRPEIAKMMRNAWNPETFDVEDFAVALVHFANDATLLLRTCWAAHIDAETSPCASSAPKPARQRSAGGLPQPRRHPGRRAPADPEDEPYEREIAHWLRVVRARSSRSSRRARRSTCSALSTPRTTRCRGREVEVEPVPAIQARARSNGSAPPAFTGRGLLGRASLARCPARPAGARTRPDRPGT
jgi:predicted dehydrogenase